MPCESSRLYFFVGIKTFFSNDPTWARFWLGNENLREQLVLPGVLFRTVWSFVPCQGLTVFDLWH